MNYPLNEFKVMGQNPFEKYIGKIVKIKVTDDQRGISGRVTSIADRFVEVEHLDGRQTLIQIDQIVFISPIRGAV